VLWLIQLLSLATILWCSWVLLPRAGFAAVVASIVLAVTLYLEHQDLHGNPRTSTESPETTGIPDSQ